MAPRTRRTATTSSGASSSSAAATVDEGTQFNLADPNIIVSIQAPVAGSNPDTTHGQAAAVFDNLPEPIKQALLHPGAQLFNRALFRLDLSEMEQLVALLVNAGILVVVLSGNMLTAGDLAQEHVKQQVFVRKTRWCSCRGSEEEGNMVGCDEARCRRQWYHTHCVGLEDAQGNAAVPEGRWVCEECEGMVDRQWTA